MEKENEFCYVSVDDVKKHGTTKAIILGRIRHWITFNEKRNKHFYSNHYWTGYLSANTLSKQTGIPYTTVKRSLKEMVDDCIITKGNFNTNNNLDVTRWYCLPKEDQNGTFDPKYQNDTYENISPVSTKMVLSTEPLIDNESTKMDYHPRKYQNDTTESTKMIPAIPDSNIPDNLNINNIKHPVKHPEENLFLGLNLKQVREYLNNLFQDENEWRRELMTIHLTNFWLKHKDTFAEDKQIYDMLVFYLENN